MISLGTIRIRVSRSLFRGSIVHLVLEEINTLVVDRWTVRALRRKLARERTRGRRQARMVPLS